MIVETASGKVRGTQRDGAYAFKGIPYGGDTGGAFRFQPPRPVAWAGVRDALAYGARSPQDEPPTNAPHHTWLRDPGACAENCLVLNVFTSSLDDARGLPVMVYLHGGGFMMGAAGAPGLDGSNLARRGVVVVTFNHRLNVFGYLHLGNADEGRYSDSGNAGMLDCVAVLEWVKGNIARFGGDPGNVTIFGQSGGGSKVAVLMAMPRARGLFHKAIVQSASSLLRLATLEEAERNTHHFLAQLQLDRSKLHALHELPPATLLKAMAEAVKAAGGVYDFRPVVDGRTVPCQPFAANAEDLSGHVPLMIGWCENEQRLTFSAAPEIYRQSMQEAVAGVARVVGTTQADAQRLIDVYGKGRPCDTPGDLFTQILGDHRYRRSVTRAAEVHVASRSASTWMYLLQWKTPVLGGLLRTPHTLCIPFAFANVDLATGITGTEPDRAQLQDEMSGAWVAFARTGDPNHSSLPAWRPYSVNERSTMVFDRQTRVVSDPLSAERIAFEPYPRYVPALGEGGGDASRRADMIKD